MIIEILLLLILESIGIILLMQQCVTHECECRVEKYERDLKRWEFMDEENERESKRLVAMSDKYLTGRRNRGGAAYNILSL